MSVPIQEVTPEMAAGLADRFVQWAVSMHGIELDYSVASLERVDAIIDYLRRDGRTVEGDFLALFMAGCYLGEVLVRERGLQWVGTESTQYQELGTVIPIVVKYAPGAFSSPIGKVIKRMSNGAEDDLPSYYHSLGTRMEDRPG